MINKHTFHIPVMGIGYTVDTPLKVAVYGIDSVISLVDDILLEKLRKYYTSLHHIDYKEITNKINDYRALRITAYLDLIHDLIDDKINRVKNVTSLNSNLLKDYIKHLPNGILKKKLSINSELSKVKSIIEDYYKSGAIDVNIMTKVDKANFKDHKQLPIEYNDAHAALRGFANSKISSSVVLSAGMNPKLFNYIENFNNFFPDENGFIKKKIILKVSDYRSALIQGKYLAKKGLWVSEYRIESGLNCGGHAFATNGYLLGPVLEEFKVKRTELYQTTYDLFVKSLKSKSKAIPNTKPKLKISAQGGIGTTEEHQFLLNHYQLDSIGWGSPFLLVPEATSTDEDTINKLIKAKEEDIYLSNISPLGIPFNNLRGNSQDEKKELNIQKNRPGSSCPKKHVALNYEFKKEGLCIASRAYQHLKIKQLQENEKLNTNTNKLAKEINKITEKSCICVGLGTSALLKYDINTKTEGKGVSICPGPNVAYFDKKISLKNMLDHIYGKTNVMVQKYRPHVFAKELSLYVDYLTKQLDDISNMTEKQRKNLTSFSENILLGIHYYQNLFNNKVNHLIENQYQSISNLSSNKEKVLILQSILLKS